MIDTAKHDRGEVAGSAPRKVPLYSRLAIPLFVVSIVTFVTSVVIHILGWTGIGVGPSHPLFAAMHLLVMVCGGSSIIVVTRVLTRFHKKSMGLGFSGLIPLFRAVRPRFAQKVLVPLVFLFLWTAPIPFLLQMPYFHTVEVRNGKPYATSHGKVIREISERELQRHEVAPTIAFSAMWIPFGWLGVTVWFVAAFGRIESGDGN